MEPTICGHCGCELEDDGYCEFCDEPENDDSDDEDPDGGDGDA